MEVFDRTTLPAEGYGVSKKNVTRMQMTQAQDRITYLETSLSDMKKVVYNLSLKLDKLNDSLETKTKKKTKVS